ncbi:MAG TPA: putative toxin-antitoxin system toxin component, PIN family [Chitinophagaceae bacterium]|nr:putative toxin-antitoxin system toxin component, PIN family [Chitinophagaceae bacterium]
MRINRFVLDTNIWISYFITKSESKLIDIVTEHKITFFCCDELLAELRQVITYPHLKKYQINLPHAISFIRSLSVFVILTYPIKRYIPEDENDDYIIALALQTNSGFITSGDSHILSEKSNLEKNIKTENYY